MGFLSGVPFVSFPDNHWTHLTMISPTFIRWYTWPRTTLLHTVSPLAVRADRFLTL
jgi:hypothetical protein